MNPDLGAALFGVALVERKRQHEAEACALMEQAIGRGDLQEGLVNPVAFYSQLAFSYYALGRTAQAEWAFREALRRDALEWEAALNLARLLAAQEHRRAEVPRLIAEARWRAQRQGADPARVDEAARQIDALAH